MDDIIKKGFNYKKGEIIYIKYADEKLNKKK